MPSSLELEFSTTLEVPSGLELCWFEEFELPPQALRSKLSERIAVKKVNFVLFFIRFPLLHYALCECTNTRCHLHYNSYIGLY